MKKIKLATIELLLLALMISLSGCQGDEITYKWGETPRQVIKRLNKKRVKYYFDEDEKKATIIVESSDLDEESGFDERVYYFTKERIQGNETKNYGEGRLVLIGNSMSGDAFSEEKAMKEIQRTTSEYGEPETAPEEGKIDGYTWIKDKTEVATRYYEEEGIFRITMKMKEGEGEELEEGIIEEGIVVKEKVLKYEWDEDLKERIDGFQKNDIVYYLKGNEKINAIYVSIDGKSLNSSEDYMIYYYKKSDDEMDGKLFIVGENIKIDQNNLENKLKELDERENVKHTVIEELEGSISYKWSLESDVMEGMYDKENKILYLAKKKN